MKNIKSKVLRFAIALVIAVAVAFLFYKLYTWLNKFINQKYRAENPAVQLDDPAQSLGEEYLNIDFQEVTVYFLDTEKFVDGTEPYEVPVKRLVVAGLDPKSAVIQMYYSMPTTDEVESGLEAIYSGTTNATVSFDENTGIARVDLIGRCDAGGSAYNLASLININLKQFDDVLYVRIYDQNGQTLSEEGELEDSTPECLQP